MTRTIRRFSFILVCALLAYLLFWPVPLDPVAWSAPANAGYVGPYAANHKLAGLKRHDLMGHHGPEDLAIGADGALYINTGEGDILRRAPDGELTVFAQTNGRPLGIEMGPDGALWVADAYQGLMRVDDNGVTLVLDETRDGTPIRYANSLDFAPDGAIWLSDASTRFGARQWGGTLEASYLEILEHGRSGRIIRFDPSTGVAEIKLAGISFANGVAMGATGEWLLFCETGESALRKLWIKGPRAGEVEDVLTGLPGYPDNIKRDAAGGFLLGLVSKRSAAADKTAPYPFLRKIVQRLPAAMRPKAVSYGFVIHLNEDGEVTETWQDPAADYPLVTGAVRDPDGSLWVSSLGADWLAQLVGP
ncbi:strictosidine synthase family protein [Rhodobacteraceae bacterium F11138]|nr:strictosidine synthase family protein [Rhodobacteraceae bacterium F11138]